jgi:hypothetical protein
MKTDDGATSHHLTDSKIVMAEQSSHDVVNQTRSGGELSPSDVLASKPDNYTAGGDVGKVENNTKNQTHQQMKPGPREDTSAAFGTQADFIPHGQPTIGSETVSGLNLSMTSC